MWQKYVAKLQEIEKTWTGPIMPSSDLKLGKAELFKPQRVHLHKHQELLYDCISPYLYNGKNTAAVVSKHHQCHNETGSTITAEYREAYLPPKAGRLLNLQH